MSLFLLQLEYQLKLPVEQHGHTPSYRPLSNIFAKHFLIIIAYGITIHKSEEMSLKNCIVDIGNTVFFCGQIYMVLSRVTSLDGLYIIPMLDLRETRGDRVSLFQKQLF